jgi:hypothetical protein
MLTLNSYKILFIILKFCLTDKDTETNRKLQFNTRFYNNNNELIFQYIKLSLIHF